MNDSALLEDLVDRTKLLVNETELSSPEQDWPILALLGRRDVPGFVTEVLGIEIRTDQEKSEAFDQELPQAVAEAKAQLLILVLPSWRVNLEPGQPDPAPEARPSVHPNRQEVVFITAVTRQGSAVAFAEVNRYPDRRPTLSDWTRVRLNSDHKVTSSLLAASLLVLEP